MGLKNNNTMVLKVGLLLLFLLGVASARLELSKLTHRDSSSDRSESEPCCNTCVCTMSNPPQCRCADIRFGSCHSACKKCKCTGSMPGQCRCLDTTDFCYEPCKEPREDEDE